MRSVKFATLGCKVNQYDTQEIREQLACLGFKEAAKGAHADLVLLNTCTVTHRADAESLYLVNKLRRENPSAKMVITGCLAQVDGKRISEKYPDAVVLGNAAKPDIAGKVAEIFCLEEKGCACPAGISFLEGRTRAFLKVQDGCDNCCAYCKVPQARGHSRSKPLEEALAEAARLAGKGAKEIVLTGICLGSYGRGLKPGGSLEELIDGVEGIPGIVRIRLSSIEVGDVSDGIAARMAASNKLCPHLHIPLQSGSDAMLKRMRRKYTAEMFLSRIRRLREMVPDIAISTDLIVGFPGETQEDVENTARVLEQVNPLKVHFFPYSPRPGTFACEKYAGEGSEVAAKESISFLKKIADACSKKYVHRFMHREVLVLLERKIPGKPGYWEGYTPHYIRVRTQLEGGKSNLLIPFKMNGLGDLIL